MKANEEEKPIFSYVKTLHEMPVEGEQLSSPTLAERAEFTLKMKLCKLYLCFKALGVKMIKGLD